MLSRTPKTPSNLRQSSNASTPPTINRMDEDGTSQAVESNLMNLNFRGSDVGSNKFSVKDQERLMDEMKRENFDLKLKLTQAQDKLAKLSNSPLDKALEDRERLAIKTEALTAETRQYRELLEAARLEIEELNSRLRRQPSLAESSENSRLTRELEAANTQIGKLQGMIRKYEGQIKDLETENLATNQKMHQLEMETTVAQRRLTETRHTVEVVQGEIAYLEEALRAKDDTIAKYRQEMHGGVSELHNASRHVADIQEAYNRLAKERDDLARERDNLLRERDGLRRAQELALSQAASLSPLSPGGDFVVSNASPRSSLDGLDSLLVKRVGEATRRFQEMEKSTTLTRMEKEQLQQYAQQLNDALANGIGSLTTLCRQLLDAADVKRAVRSDCPTLQEAIKQVEDICSLVVTQAQEFKGQNAALETLLQSTSDALERAEAEKLRLHNQLRHADDEALRLTAHLDDKNKELQQQEEERRWLKERARRATDEEIPMLKAELRKMSERMDVLNEQLGQTQAELQSSTSERQDLRKRLEEQQTAALRAASDFESKRQMIMALTREKDALFAQLAKQEELCQRLRGENDEMKGKLGHHSKVRSMVEEQFSSELTTLHQQNSELKVALNAGNLAKADLQKRLDNLQTLYAQADARLDQQTEQVRALQSELAMLQRHGEQLRAEKAAAEAELQDKLAVVGRLEMDVQKLRRLEPRKGTEGAEHLMAKIDNMTALNAFLKEQAEAKERQVRDLEERLRRQEDDVKRAYAELDAKTAKLKKRETLINQALKRLEAINFVVPSSAAAAALGRDGGKENKDEELRNLEF